MRRALQSVMLALFMACSLSVPAHAQDRNPLNLVIGFPPGASFDNLSRLLAEQLGRVLQRTVIVENRTGASGRLAVDYVRRQPANGDTVLLAPMANMAIFPHTYRKLSYDPFKDFAPVSLLAAFGLAWAVHPDVPATTLGEYVELVKQDARMGQFGSTGVGTPSHFFAVMYQDAAGMELLHVPHRGAADVMTALVGGHIKAAILSVNDVERQHSAGRVRALGVSAAQRESILPDVPTFREAGYDLEGSFWYGAYVPANTPADVVDTLAAAFARALAAPEVRQYAAQSGLALLGGGPAELARVQREDYERWGPPIRATGFMAED